MRTQVVLDITPDGMEDMMDMPVRHCAEMTVLAKVRK